MKRIEQKVEDTWCLEDMFESDEFLGGGIWKTPENDFSV